MVMVFKLALGKTSTYFATLLPSLTLSPSVKVFNCRLLQSTSYGS